MFRKYAKILQKNTHAKLQFHFIKIAPQDGCSPVNLMDVFQTVFYRNSPWGVLMKFIYKINIFSFNSILVYSWLGKTQNIETYVTIHFVIRVCFSKILKEETFCCIAFYIYSQVRIKIHI